MHLAFCLRFTVNMGDDWQSWSSEWGHQISQEIDASQQAKCCALRNITLATSAVHYPLIKYYRKEMHVCKHCFCDRSVMQARLGQTSKGIERCEHMMQQQAALMYAAKSPSRKSRKEHSRPPLPPPKWPEVIDVFGSLWKQTLCCIRRNHVALRSDANHTNINNV